MSTTNRRKALTQYLIKELGKSGTKEFSQLLRDLDICDLRIDEQLDRVTQDGLIDTLVVLYKFGTLSKLYHVKKEIKD